MEKLPTPDIIFAMDNDTPKTIICGIDAIYSIGVFLTRFEYFREFPLVEE